MNKATLSLSHPILFVMDFGNSEVVVPEYSAESTVSATSSCISIRGIADVDGDLTVRLIREQDMLTVTGLLNVFEGPLATPGKKAAIVTSSNEKVMEIDVAGDVTSIRVSVDDTEFPSEILVETL